MGAVSGWYNGRQADVFAIGVCSHFLWERKWILTQPFDDKNLSYSPFVQVNEKGMTTDGNQFARGSNNVANFRARHQKALKQLETLRSELTKNDGPMRKLIARCLHVDPMQRPTMEEIAADPVFQHTYA